MKQQTLELIDTLKERGEDFEWYPTTPGIISDVKSNIHEGASVLDIGAGRGDVLRGIKDKAGDLYAIEKSQTLISTLPASVFVVGTDFERQTLIDKEVDVIFSNPPFSSFVPWACKIIREANAETVLLVLPERWKESKTIKAACAARDVVAHSVGSYSFAKAERAARGVVNLVHISLHTTNYNSGELKSDPFKVWFESEFETSADKAESVGSDWAKKESAKDHLHELIEGRNVIERLEELYLAELETIISTYRKIAEIPPELLEEVGVKKGAVCGALKQKLKGLKNKYWRELFDNLDKITERLTSKSRGELLKTLTANTHIDFSSSNAYAVVIWAIKNANKYLDSQLVELYKALSNQESAKAYKSNRHFNGADFRFHRWDDGEHPERYALDYRIVYEYGRCFDGYNFELSRNHGISITAGDLINDVCTVGHNLGFDVFEQAASFNWTPGKRCEFSYMKDAESFEYEDFMTVRAYKNGNLHFKLNQNFLLKLNIEAARILGWVNSPKEAAEEMGEPFSKVSKHWNTSFRITLSDTKLLPTPKAA